MKLCKFLQKLDLSVFEYKGTQQDSYRQMIMKQWASDWNISKICCRLSEMQCLLHCRRACVFWAFLRQRTVHSFAVDAVSWCLCARRCSERYCIASQSTMGCKCKPSNLRKLYSWMLVPFAPSSAASNIVTSLRLTKCYNRYGCLCPSGKCAIRKLLKRVAVSTVFGRKQRQWTEVS